MTRYAPPYWPRGRRRPPILVFAGDFTNFLKTGRLPVELARGLAGLQQQREDADYERDLQIDAEQAQLAQQDAAWIRSAIETWLAEHGWLE